MVGRDIILGVSVQNRASGSLRGIGRNIRRQMEEVQRLERTAAQARVTAGRATQARLNTASQLATITNGKRRINQTLTEARLAEQAFRKERTVEKAVNRVNKLKTDRIAIESALASAQSAESGRQRKLTDATEKQAKATKRIRVDQLTDRRNQLVASEAMARTDASRLRRFVKQGRPLKGFTFDETKVRAAGAAARAKGLKQEIGTAEQAVANAKQTLKDHELQVKRLQERYGQAGISVQKFGRRLEENAANITAAERDVTGARQSLSNLSIAHDKAAASARELAEREAFLKDQLVLAGEAEQVAAARANELAIAQDRAARSGMRLAAAKDVGHIGRQAAIGGFVGTAIMGFAAKQAADFQTQVALAATQVTPPQSRVGGQAGPAITGKLMQIVLNQMQRFPATSKEMADSLYEIFSSTNIQRIPKATAALDVFNRMAVAGGASLAEMTRAGVIIYNNFPGEFKNMTQAANVFFAAVRYGYTTAGQLANVLGYVVPIAKEVGQTFKNTAADMAFMTRQTGPRMIRQDAQGLARLIQLFGRTDVTMGLEKHGVHVWDEHTHKMRRIVDIIKDIQKAKIAQTPQQMLNFFKSISSQGSGKAGTTGTIQAIRIFANGIKNAAAYRDVVRHVNKDNNEFLRSYQIMSKSPGVQWKVFTNQLKAMFIVLGQGAIPAFIKFGQYIKRAVEWFQSLGSGTQKSIGFFLALISILTLLGGVITMIAAGIASLAIGLRMGGGGGFGGIGKGIASLGGEAAGGASAMSFFAREAGHTNVETAALRFSFLGLIPVMIMFHSQIGSIISSFGGLSGMIGIISALLIGRLARSLVIAAEEFAFAATWALKLRLALLAIPTVIAIMVLFNVNKKNIENVAVGLARQVGNPVLKVGNWLGKQTGLGSASPLVASAKDTARVKKEAKELEKLGYSPGLKGFLGGVNTDEVKRIDDLYRANVGGMTKTQKKAAELIVQRERAARHSKHSVQDFWGTMGGEGKKPKSTPAVDMFHWSKQAQAAFEASQRAAKGMGASATPTFRRLYDAYAKAAKAAAADPTNYKKQFAARMAYDRLVQNATKQQVAAAQKAIDAEIAANKNGLNTMADDRKQAMQEAQSQMQTGVSTLMSAWQNALSSSQSQFGQLFQGPFSQSPAMKNLLQFTGGQMTGPQMVKDLESSTAQFRKRMALLQKTGRRGAPPELQTALQGLSFDELKKVAGLSPKDWQKLLNAWKQGQALIKQEAQREFNQQVQQWFKFGRKVAQAIITGIKSQDADVEQALKNWLIGAFPGLAGKAKEHKQPIPKAKDRPQVTVNVHPTHTPDVKTQAKHGVFVASQKWNGSGRF